MKILCINNVRMPTEKAYGVALMRQCEAFAKLGHEVVLAYAKRKNPIKDELFAYFGIEPCFRTRVLWEVDMVGLGKLGTIVTILTFFPYALWCVSREKPDMIFTRDDFTAAFLSLFFKNVVWEVHNARTSRHRCFARARAKMVVYISNGLKDFYARTCKRPAKKELVAPSGVALEPFEAVTESKEELRRELGIPVDKKVVGYVGKMTTMGEGKGVDTLIEAFSKVIKEVPDAFLLLVGAEEGEKMTLRHEITKLSIPDGSYKIAGHVAQQIVPRYLKSCDCLVLCYPDSEHYRLYMSPLKLFEYMASGIPIVVSDYPSVREVVGDYGAVEFAAQDNQHELKTLILRTLQLGVCGKSARTSWTNRAETITSYL